MGIPLLKIGAILLLPIHFLCRAARAGVLGVVCGVWRISDRRCEERQFQGSDGRDSRDWSEEVCSAVVPWCSKKLSPPSSASGTVDLDGRFQRRRELLFPRHTSRRWKITWGREREKRGEKRNFTPATQAPSFSSLPRASSDFFVWDPRWGRSRNFLRRRGRETSPRWRSFYPGSDSPQAPAAARLGPVEAATAAGTAPPLIRSPVCSGRL